MFEQMMQQMNDEMAAKVKPRPLPEAQIADIRLYAERINAPCPFKAGDLVTPRQSSNIKDAGEPHIVIEVFSEPQRFWGADAASAACGQLLTIRVAALAPDGKSYVAWSVQHGDFEPYIGEGA